MAQHHCTRHYHLRPESKYCTVKLFTENLANKTMETLQNNNHKSFLKGQSLDETSRRTSRKLLAAHSL